jgi:MYXO-CTERM domain-containing protein
MTGILATVYSLAVLVVALLGFGYVLGVTTDRSDRGSWWAWGLLVVVAVFLLAEVGLLLVAG